MDNALHQQNVTATEELEQSFRNKKLVLCSATGGQFYNFVDLASTTIQLKIFVGSIFGVRRVITESRVLRWIIKHLTKRS
ncbi:hypothetical protein ACLKA6_008524 [Drosophila palustris]